MTTPTPAPREARETRKRVLHAQARTKAPTVKPRRGGGFDVVIPCVGSRANAERAAKMVGTYLLAHRQSCREAGGVRLNELSDVMYSLGLVMNPRLTPKEHDPAALSARETGQQT